MLSTGTPRDSRTQALVDLAERILKRGSRRCSVARKAVCIIEAPVPQTDTGSQDEDSKANGRRVVKELGKLTP